MPAEHPVKAAAVTPAPASAAAPAAATSAGSTAEPVKAAAPSSGFVKSRADMMANIPLGGGPRPAAAGAAASSTSSDSAQPSVTAGAAVQSATAGSNPASTGSSSATSPSLGPARGFSYFGVMPGGGKGVIPSADMLKKTTPAAGAAAVLPTLQPLSSGHALNAGHSGSATAAAAAATPHQHGAVHDAHVVPRHSYAAAAAHAAAQSHGHVIGKPTHAAVQHVAPVLPPFWSQHTDHTSGNTYFYNAQTKERYGFYLVRLAAHRSTFTLNRPYVNLFWCVYLGFSPLCA